MCGIALGQPAPYETADDDVLVEGCRRADPDALQALVDRHGALAQLTALRERDALDLSALLLGRLRADDTALRPYAPQSCTLRAYLSAWLRREERAQGRWKTQVISPLPTPVAVERALHEASASHDALVGAAREILARQPPHVVAIVRLRLEGLPRAPIGALLGASEAQVRAALERVAARLSEGLPHHEQAEAALAYRVLLDASPPEERVGFCRRSETDRELAKIRARVEVVLRRLRDEVARHVARAGPQCPSVAAIAGYVDGTMRGALRASTEVHVTSCFSCLDEIGALSVDLRALPILREAQGIDRGTLVAAMGLSVAAFEPATALADSIAARRDVRTARLAADLARLGRACRVLVGGSSPLDRETSGLVSRDVPSDDEAPLVAFEALALGDSGTAFRAIDEANAPAPVAARVRVLAAAAGGDAPLGHAWARAVRGGYDVDPGAIEDAECVLALGEGEALPREIVAERLRALVPDLVRVVLALHARPAR